MSEEDDKQHEPSQKRLDEARKRGEVVKSTDLLAAAGYLGLLLVGLVGGEQPVDDAVIIFCAVRLRRIFKNGLAVAWGLG